MKRNLVAGFMVVSMTFASLSYADYSFHLSENTCDQIAGTWEGTGRAYNWLIGTCIYHGTGQVSTVDSSGNFSVDASADKDSGSIVCPNHANETLYGTCVNGFVTIKTDYGDLTGTFTNTTGSASGTVTVSPGMSADVSVQFKRAR